MRKSTAFLFVLAIQLLVAAGLVAHGRLASIGAEPRLSGERMLVQRLMLTDLALFTEARYTRHLSQADLHTPFQDFPLSLEHFPSGSFVQPAPGHFRQEP